MNDITCKVLVIGAGPGGYACAIRAGQLGLDTVIVGAARMGGTCLNVGCIPSKALIHAADQFAAARRFAQGNPLGIGAGAPRIDLRATMAWKDGIVARLSGGVGALLKKAGVRSVIGRARFVDGKTVRVATDTGDQLIRAQAVVIATGSEPVALGPVPFGGPVLSSTEALALDAVPGSLAVIGGGYIGLEIGTALRKLGAEVTVIEAEARILPQYDAELTRPVARRLEALGVRVLTGTRASGWDAGKGRLTVTDAAGKTQVLTPEQVLVTVGRRPRTVGVGLEELSLRMEGAAIAIDHRCQTSMRGVHAIGDVTGEPMLAHRAIAQGEMVAAILAGQPRQWDKQAMPAVCFTDPEIVTVGLAPEAARAAGHEVVVGKFPFAANGRALTMEQAEGFVRITARARDHVVLGVQACGQGVSELAAAFGLALEMGVRLEDIAATVHAHPTQGEALQEAALAGLGHALHL